MDVKKFANILQPIVKESSPIGVGKYIPDLPYDKQALDNNANLLVTPSTLSSARDFTAQNQSGWDLAGVSSRHRLR